MSKEKRMGDALDGNLEFLVVKKQVADFLRTALGKPLLDLGSVRAILLSILTGKGVTVGPKFGSSTGPSQSFTFLLDRTEQEQPPMLLEAILVRPLNEKGKRRKAPDGTKLMTYLVDLAPEGQTTHR